MFPSDVGQVGSSMGGDDFVYGILTLAPGPKYSPQNTMGAFWPRLVLRKFSSRGDATVRFGGGMLLLTPTRRHGSCVALSPCLSEPFGDIR